MGFIDFRKVFSPTKEEIKLQEKRMEEIHNQCVEDRVNVNLIPTESPFLYRREPFSGFLGDCTYCSYYESNNVGFSDGGWCKLCGDDCGWVLHVQTMIVNGR